MNFRSDSLLFMLPQPTLQKWFIGVKSISPKESDFKVVSSLIFIC
jgi:hypothetical protein